MIDPVTRVEGHGRVTIQVDDAGRVSDALFHIVEFRGFERFVQGRPYWEAPVLVQRLCGICPVSHHLAAAKAIDRLAGVEPADLPPTATAVRRLLHYGQVLQSHALHFFYLASPDLLFGPDAPVEKRNVIAVAQADRELAKKGILLRRYGQEIIQALTGKRIHGVTAVPGGVHQSLDPAERDRFLQGTGLPSADTVVQWCLDSIDFLKKYHLSHRDWLDRFADFPSNHLGLVGPDGALELYDGRLRAVDTHGARILDDVPDYDYVKYFAEGVQPWTYLKFPYLRHLGQEKGWNRVGPLARLNVADFIPTPLAEKERQEYFAFAGIRPVGHSMYYHWARLIEMLHCAELVRDLLQDPLISGKELRTEGTPRREGIGIIEAPRGTLIHHYQVNAEGRIERCNLIVSTTHNNEAMNRAVRWVASEVLDGQPELTEGLLNQVEVAIRAYDPCLSCATHAMGQMPLRVELVDQAGRVLQTLEK